MKVTVLPDDVRVEAGEQETVLAAANWIDHALIPADDPGLVERFITRGTTIYFFDPSGNRNEVFAGLGHRTFPDFPTVNWTEDQLAKGIVHISRELKDSFTTVFT